MGKIVASYLVKVHLHAPDSLTELEKLVGPADVTPPNDSVKASLIDGLAKELGVEVTVSLIERTDD
ncbi:MAG TPA: hypothetical protein VIM05_03220 [Gaiellaceae bacterium]